MTDIELEFMNEPGISGFNIQKQQTNQNRNSFYRSFFHYYGNFKYSPVYVTNFLAQRLVQNRILMAKFVFLFTKQCLYLCPENKITREGDKSPLFY